METLLIDRREGVALITIERPEALNALNDRVFRDLDQCLDELADDAEIGAVILTGSGEKAFVAGADIKELATLDTLSAKTLSARGQRVFNKIETLPKPVVAAVNGFALGGGCELAMACHFRVASERAKFGLPEVGLGLIPGYAGTQRLPRLVGKGVAMELVLTGDMIDAARAHAIGLVNHVVRPEDLVPFTLKLVGKILKKGPLAVRHALEAVTAGVEMSREDGERLEAALFGILATTEDTKEGLAAFIEKRPPQFKGR
ncbi:Enoyl-CoA hydratase/isomerase family protein [Sulfidibacter corallicola]|uniref:Enoyl-CoA hydratase/isomerase family protein n=1 Tax=Sulfidibacter corallicola TaxID=2818388 RepID=A0A8A4TJX2_SULCO|nr:enoyl-CoA hydratase-related protein [Sulfidibacter corallicola]QTD50319.1 enoyl-CoA hydratase/isomerase family protein [Sulfidibacter corallicola]